MRTAARILLCGLLALWPAAAAAGAAASAPVGAAEVAESAAASLQGFLAEVPDSELPLLGFADRPEAVRAATGRPFAIHTVAPGSLMALAAPGRLGALLVETGLWYVPVLVDGEPRALLTVAVAPGTAETIGLSAAGLAREIGAFEGWRRSEGGALLGEPRFVRIRQAVADFMVLETADGELLRPFASARAALGIRGEALLSPAAAVPGLRAAVRRGLEQ